jgi:hypothetical protein
VSCCTDQYEPLLAPHTLALTMAVRNTLETLVDWGLSLLVRCGGPNREMIVYQLARNLDQFVRSVLRTRLALFSAVSMTDYRFYTLAPSNVPPHQISDAMNASHLCHDSAFRWAKLNAMVYELAREARNNLKHECRNVLRGETVRDLNTTRLELAQRLYRTRAPRLLSANELPSVLSGVMEGLDPNEVRAGLARTVALAGGTDFGVDVPTPNGVIADWLDDRDMGTEAMLTDLRRAPSAASCPTLVADDQFGPLPDDVPVW